MVKVDPETDGGASFDEGFKPRPDAVFAPVRVAFTNPKDEDDHQRIVNQHVGLVRRQGCGAAEAHDLGVPSVVEHRSQPHCDGERGDEFNVALDKRPHIIVVQHGVRPEDEEELVGEDVDPVGLEPPEPVGFVDVWIDVFDYKHQDHLNRKTDAEDPVMIVIQPFEQRDDQRIDDV